MWHTFLYSTIALNQFQILHIGVKVVNRNKTDFNVDNVTAFEDFHIGSQRNSSIFLEISREQMASTTTITFWICHSSNGTDELMILL